MAKKKSTKRRSKHAPRFEEALGNLETIVHRLEGGQLGLNEALEEYETGVGLLRQCYDLLQKAELRIEMLAGIDGEGRPITTPIDDPAGEPSPKTSRSPMREARRRSDQSDRPSVQPDWGDPGAPDSGDIDMDL